MWLQGGVTTANFVRQLLYLFNTEPLTPASAIAAMLTIMSGAPFHGQEDINQGIAYIAVVVVFFMVRTYCMLS